MPIAPSPRPVRIANVSGFFGDRLSALREIVQGGPVDVITGDYLAEVTMRILGKLQAKNPGLGFAPTFIAQLEPVMGEVLSRGIRVVVNAGGLNPRGLGMALLMIGQRLGLAPRIAVVEGDDLRSRLDELREKNGHFMSLESGEPLPATPGHVHTANAYLGAWGIVRALQEGADIVITGRVTDASLVVGTAAWWHGWSRDDWHKLAGAVAAGHVIECGPQATGGNYSSFLSLGAPARPAFPIAEVAADGSSVITKHEGQPGAVTVGTVTAQLVYEVTGARYLNPDVTTHLDTITLTQEAPDRVALRGTRGSPPPPTTKVAITTKGPFRNEMTFAFVGLDIDAKIELFERTTRAASLAKKAQLTFQRVGSAVDDAPTQDGATVLLRVIATSDDEAAVGRPFQAALIEQGLSSYPGLFATGLPGDPVEASGYWPTLVAQADLVHQVILPDGRTETIALPPVMAPVAATPASEATAGGYEGETTRGPLGWLVDARSGDKGSDANVGLWVRDRAAYGWLASELTVARLRELLPEAASLAVERHEFPGLGAVNFVIHGLLAGGAIATLRFDRQAKALGEFLRSRHVELPREFLPTEG